MITRSWAPALLLTVLVAACGGDDEARPARPDVLGAEMPATIATVCTGIAGDSEVPVLCPPAGGSGGPLDVIHEDLDPEPCGYLINLEAPVDRRDGAAPSHAVIGGRCTPLPVDEPPGPWPAEPPESLRLVANPPLESGRQPRVARPEVLRPIDVRGRQGLLMQSAPGTEGGFHGSHYELVWNEGGAGYTVSLHWPSGDRGAAPTRRQVELLLTLARSLEPAV